MPVRIPDLQEADMSEARTVAIIPARGGSKGVPGKNLRPLAGRPLVVHSIVQALAAETVDAVYVSTDDEAIAEVSTAAGAQVIRRPAAISGDTSPSEAALQHALDVIAAEAGEPHLMVFLQATSPLRTAADIDAAVRKLEVDGADSLLSVSPSHRFLWRLKDGYAEAINYDYRHRPRRQDMTPQYVENGSIYVFSPDVLRRFGNRLGGHVALYEMPEQAALEIDSELDFQLMEAIMKQGVYV